MAKENYRRKKMEEFLDENAESMKENADNGKSAVDYNIMMGVLLDPEEGENADAQPEV